MRRPGVIPMLRSRLGSVLCILVVAAWAVEGYTLPAHAQPPLLVEATADGQSVTIRPQTSQPYTIYRRAEADGGKYTLYMAEYGADGRVRIWPIGMAIGGPSPGPTPDPRPEPRPVPPPPAKVAAIYVIYESGDRPPAVAAVIDSAPWREACKAAGITFRALDQDVAAKALPGATAKAKVAGLPAVVGVDRGGNAIVEKLPATAEALAALVKTWGGGK